MPIPSAGRHLRVVPREPAADRTVHPLARRVALAAVVAALGSGVVLLLGRVGSGEPGWPVALALFALLFGAQLIGPGPRLPARRR